MNEQTEQSETEGMGAASVLMDGLGVTLGRYRRKKCRFTKAPKITEQGW